MKVQAITFDNEDDIYKYNVECRFSRGTLITAHTADLHFPVFDPKVQYTILKEQFVNVLYELPVLDIVFINGDIFEHKVLSSSEGAMYATMFVGDVVELCRVKNATLIILHGTASHDCNQLKLFYHYITDQTVDVRIITNLQFEYVKGAKILCIPEMYGVDEDVYSEYLLYSGVYDMAVMHGMFQGAVAGDNTNSRLFRISDFCNCRGPIISGHVHKPGCFDKYFYYTGSPYRWRFDDDHTKGFIIMAMNLDNGYHYCYYKEITSFIYRTIHIDSLISNDPRDIIEYINKLKTEQGIDYIRVIFDTEVPGSDKTIINNYYRDSRYTVVKFLDLEAEAAKKKEIELDDEYSFILDKLSGEEILCRYANVKKGYEYITIDELTRILSEDI